MKPSPSLWIARLAAACGKPHAFVKEHVGHTLACETAGCAWLRDLADALAAEDERAAAWLHGIRHEQIEAQGALIEGGVHGLQRGWDAKPLDPERPHRVDDDYHFGQCRGGISFDGSPLDEGRWEWRKKDRSATDVEVAAHVQTHGGEPLPDHPGVVRRRKTEVRPGDAFGALVVTAEISPDERRRRRFECKCTECGKERHPVRIDHLLSGSVRSCCQGREAQRAYVDRKRTAWAKGAAQ